MPKRPQTPDSGPEIVRILAVHYPYPSQANLEQIPEQADFMSWVVGCLGDPSLLHAIGWKPRTPNVVLIYVSKDVSNWRMILGEHKWSEVFLPGYVSERDLRRHSRIFFSKYSSHRTAEKDGWKIKYITDVFLKKNLAKICNEPYPPTAWCPTPDLDKTNDSWVRPLPLEHFPETPKPAPKPVVGSAAWAAGNGAKRNGPLPKKVNPAPGGAWAKPPSTRSGPTTAATPNVWAPGVPKANTIGSQHTRPPASSSIAPTRPSASVSGSATVLGGGSTCSGAATVIDIFDEDEDFESQISSVTDSLAETKLFSSNPKSTDDTLPTTNVEQTNEADTGFENAWETTEPEEKDNVERAKCPAHQKLCNPNMCHIIVPHCKSLGLDIRQLKLGGANNIYTLEQERKAEPRSRYDRGRGRGDNRRRPNPASDRW